MRENPLSYQVGGQHYQVLGDAQPWIVQRKRLTSEQMIGFLLGTADKYLARFNSTAPGKGGLEAIQKAMHTLQYLQGILVAEQTTGDPPPQERALYCSAPGARRRPCTVQARFENKAFIRLDEMGGGFWVDDERISQVEETGASHGTANVP